MTLLHDNTSGGMGRYGEYLTYTWLKDYELNGGKFLFNLYIPKGNGQTSEIDILLICSKGIFCFESKHYSGWIFGSEYQKKWCQTLPQWNGKSHKEYFNNPIIQNKTHIKYLKNLIGERFPVYSVIVFSERCTLKDIQIKSNHIHVINRYNVVSLVSGICSQIPDEPLSEDDIDRLYHTLYPYTQSSEVEKLQHIANIKENLTSTTTLSESSVPNSADNTSVRSEKIETPSTSSNHMKTIEKKNNEKTFLKCPLCGGNLILRVAKRGQHAGNQFYGCSNYPKCRYIQNT